MTQDAEAHTKHSPLDTRRTTCCIVGAGPAGAMLALLLARQNVPVVLLEACQDFDRDFRGDSIHPAILETLDAIGLADRLLQLPHRKLHGLTIPTEPPATIPFEHLPTRFPYMVMLPQARFLAFLTRQAKRWPSFELVMGANVQQLVKDDGVIQGVRYRSADGWHEVHALLTVGADGRASRVRRLADLRAIPTSQPIDILWFRLPRRADDPEGFTARVGHGHFLLMVDRGEEWQVGCTVPKSSYPHLRAAGLEAFRRTVSDIVPWLGDRMDALADWKQLPLLRVASDRLPRWYKPGLLMIGDAAHVMSPFGGNGVNYAVQDAVTAANVLFAPLKTGRVGLRHLRTVQRQRDWPTRATQFAVSLIQRVMSAGVFRMRASVRPPAAIRLLVRMPLLTRIPVRWVAFGLCPAHVSAGLKRAALTPDPMEGEES